MTGRYYQPILSPLPGAHRLAGGWLWFDELWVLSRGNDGGGNGGRGGAERINAHDAPADVMARLTAPRAPLTGVGMDTPQIMGILNVTPDSFSDGGQFDRPDIAIAHAHAMAADGASIIDIGGESTRPGATFVDVDQEITRTAPVIQAIRSATDIPISIDTRKAPVAQAALDAGANWINDVSAMVFDPTMAQTAASTAAPICLMHAQGTPDVMQNNPTYDHVVCDVYDCLDQQVQAAVQAGIDRSRIIIDPGIGFGKTMDHNLTLLRHLSVFHGLGCALLLGASRKRFIGTITGTDTAADRVSGSVAIALHGLTHGVQITRVHDVRETHDAFAMYRAVLG